MTIGIGVLTSEDAKPDRLVLIADTMGSYGDSYSTNELHKIHAIEAEDLYAVSAGSLTDASELVNMIAKQLRAQATPRRYPEILHALNVSANVHRRMRFGLDCLPKYRMTSDDWFKVMDPNIRAKLLEELGQFCTGCETIVGAFDYRGMALLFLLPGDGTVKGVEFPGIEAVGTGAGNALFWLAYRQQELGCSVRRSAYHAYEAKVMAEQSAHVNERIDLVIAQKGKHFSLHHEKQSAEGCPISLPELPKLFENFNVRDTGQLDPDDQRGKPTWA